MAKIKDLKDAISWNAPIAIREKILTRRIDSLEKEIKAEEKMNRYKVDENSVINI